MLDAWLFSALGKYRIRYRLNAKMHELASEDSSQEDLALLVYRQGDILKRNLARSIIAHAV